MNIDEARRIWGDIMPDDILKEWLKLRNKIVPDDHDLIIPKGATVEIDEKTGKVVPRKDY
jgi:hypothetical protein